MICVSSKNVLLSRSHRCPQHSDEQRQSVRLLLLGIVQSAHSCISLTLQMKFLHTRTALHTLVYLV